MRDYSLFNLNLRNLSRIFHKLGFLAEFIINVSRNSGEFKKMQFMHAKLQTLHEDSILL